MNELQILMLHSLVSVLKNNIASKNVKFQDEINFTLIKYKRIPTDKYIK